MQNFSKENSVGKISLHTDMAYFYTNNYIIDLHLMSCCFLCYNYTLHCKTLSYNELRKRLQFYVIIWIVDIGITGFLL